MKQFFQLPNMKLHRDDCPDLLKDKSDDEMQEIANKLSKWLCQDWDIIIKDLIQ